MLWFRWFFLYKLGGILRFQPFIFQGFSHLSLESNPWDRGRKKGARLKDLIQGDKGDKKVTFDFQYYTPEDERLEPKNHPIYEGKSSEPNHHFQVPAVNLPGCTKNPTLLLYWHMKKSLYIYVYIYIYWVGFHPLCNLNNQGFFHCSFVQGSEFWLPCGFFKTTLKVSKVPLLLGNIPNGKNPKMLGNTTSLETGIITPFLWGPQNHHESWSWATALRSRERG